MWRLFVPLKYLLIRHPEKTKFDLVFPIVFACFFLLPTLSSDFRDAAAKMDILGRSSDLLSILTGFFVAALAAVATFGGEEMNEIMPGSSPVTLRDPYRTEPEKLSRRRFLSFLFGYLAFLSLTLYLMGFVYYGLETYVIIKYFPHWAGTSFVVFWGIYGFALGNLLANTLLGLFYLTDRIHRPNRRIYSKNNLVGPEGLEPPTKRL